MQTVGARLQRLSLDLYIVRSGEHRVFIRASTPRALAAAGSESWRAHTIRHECSPDLSPAVRSIGSVHIGTVIIDRNFHKTDILRGNRSLIVSIRRQGYSAKLCHGRLRDK